MHYSLRPDVPYHHIGTYRQRHGRCGDDNDLSQKRPARRTFREKAIAALLFAGAVLIAGWVLMPLGISKIRANQAGVCTAWALAYLCGVGFAGRSA